MTEDSLHENEHLSPNPPVVGDPELARICELSQAMTLSPRELIAKLRSDLPGAELADHTPYHEPGCDLQKRAAGVAALENLASIVTSLQSNPLPPLRTARATAFPSAAPVPAPPPIGEALGGQDDEAMPSLSTWHGSAIGDQDRQTGRQLFAAGLGLLAGLALVAMTLLWLGGWFHASPRSKALQLAPASEEPARRGEGAALRPPVEEPESAHRDAPRVLGSQLATPTAPKAPTEQLIQEALRRIESGDVLGARTLLAGVESDPQGRVPFTLAATFDPNMLAAWGTRDIAPDIENARHLYSEALSLGYAPARQRLELLR